VDPWRARRRSAREVNSQWQLYRYHVYADGARRYDLYRPHGTFSTQQKSTFVGAGPRFGVQGDIPLGGQWSIDWLAGAAVLFGERAVTLTVPGVTTFGASVSDNSRAVFNVDAQAGLSYWVTPTTKITASYRFDGYFKALKTFNSAGNVTDIDRLYNGPMLRLTTKF
jgi:Legionella pneumophila major outer membrane protein precursor